MVARNSVGLSLALALLATGTLSGCGGLKDALGANKYPPDEFAVVSKRALVIPPDYNLRPPGPNPSRRTPIRQRWRFWRCSRNPSVRWRSPRRPNSS